MNIAESHLFTRMGKTILFNCETMLFYEAPQLVIDLLHLLTQEKFSENPVRYLQQKYSDTEIQKTIFSLQKEAIIRDKKPKNPQLIRRKGIKHLELMLTHDCNMRCRYCYGLQGEKEKAPYLYGAKSGGMTLNTAKKGVDYLFEASGSQQQRLSVVFFGGEPLLEYKLMHDITVYIRKKERQSDKEVRISLSTNGLLLSDKVVTFLNRYNISCQVSMDGSKDTHDNNRLLKNGSGSYDAVYPGIKRLLKERPGKVAVRATMTHSNMKLLDTALHLHKLGFGSVHIEPDLGNDKELSIAESDLENLQFEQEKIANYLVQCARENSYFNYSNLVRFIRHISEVKERQAHYCGAGRTYFALSQDGEFFPCHRFVGLNKYQMGDLSAGIDQNMQQYFVDLTVESRPTCSTCWVRYFCGGGCWHHAVSAHGDLENPDHLSCSIIRHLVECAMVVSSELREIAKGELSKMYEGTSEPYLIPE